MKKETVLIILFCPLLLIFLLLFSYKTTLFFTPLTVEQENTLHFLQGKEELKLEYTVNEISHLNDVKKVMGFMGYFLYGVLVILTGILTYYRKNKLYLRKLLFYGGIFSVAVILMKLVFILLLFDFSFAIFHSLFFPQGNWQFPADSLLIQTFPQEFFVKIGTIIFVQALFLGMGIIASSKYNLKYHKL